MFDLARSAEHLSNDHDVNNVRKGYKGITIPTSSPFQGGFLEMDPPEQRYYRQALNPYLSPAAVQRWVPAPFRVLPTGRRFPGPRAQCVMTAVVPVYRCGAAPDSHRVPSCDGRP